MLTFLSSCSGNKQLNFLMTIMEQWTLLRQEISEIFVHIQSESFNIITEHL